MATSPPDDSMAVNPPDDYMAANPPENPMAESDKAIVKVVDLPADILLVVTDFLRPKDAQNLSKAIDNPTVTRNNPLEIKENTPGFDVAALQKFVDNDPDLKFIILNLDFNRNRRAAIQILAGMANLQHLALRQYIPTRQVTTSKFLEKPKFSSYRHPLHDLVTMNGGKNLTHLDLSSVSIRIDTLKYLPKLMYLKLTMTRSYDAYDPVEALWYIDAAKECRMVRFEIGLYTTFFQKWCKGKVKEIFQRCAQNWPGLEVLNLISDSEGLIPIIGNAYPLNDLKLDPDFAITCAETLERPENDSLKLEQISLGVIPEDADSIVASQAVMLSAGENKRTLPGLAGAFRKACPGLRIFRCIAPYIGPSILDGAGTRYYQILRAVWKDEQGQWECTRERCQEEDPSRIFGTMGE